MLISKGQNQTVREKEIREHKTKGENHTNQEIEKNPQDINIKKGVPINMGSEKESSTIFGGKSGQVGEGIKVSSTRPDEKNLGTKHDHPLWVKKNVKGGLRALVE